MKMREKQTHLSPDFPKSIPEFKAKRVSALQKLLSPEVKRLRPELSRELLFQLATHVVGTDLQSIERNFEARVRRIRPTKVKEKNGVWMLGGSSEYKRILYEAVDKHLRPLRLPVHTWEDLRKGLSYDDSSPSISVPAEFLNVADQVTANASPRKIVDEEGGYLPNLDLSEEQQGWLAADGCGIRAIGDVFYMMQYKYLTASHQQHEGKYRLINLWLGKNYPQLYEFYLHGLRHYEKPGSYFPSVRKRLRDLDELVNSENVGWHVKEAAVQELNCLIDNDLLFASVFYSYLFKGKSGKPADPKRRVLQEAMPYVYYLTFFQIKPFVHAGITVTDYLDCGVLLLNALAEEKAYSRITLSKDLTSFRKAFRQLAAQEKAKRDAELDLRIDEIYQSWLHSRD